VDETEKLIRLIDRVVLGREMEDGELRMSVDVEFG